MPKKKTNPFMPMTEPQIRRAVREESVELVNMQRRLHDAGLHATAHLVNKASQRLGWEAEEVFARLEGRTPPKRSREVMGG